MCRLFGLHAGTQPAAATFWLLNAPDNLARQSYQNPDGAGIGVFDKDGTATVDKQPIAAWNDTEFAAAALERIGTTFVAHVRHASTGAHTRENTHPFEQAGRLFAHNGVVEGLDLLDSHLRDLGVSHFVQGETDSERIFALITAEIARCRDVAIGIATGITWLASHVPVYSVNLILATATDLWALRYPEPNELWILERPGTSDTTLDAATDRIRARSDQLGSRPSVILASEPMDGESGWRLLAPGELVHIDEELTVTSTNPCPDSLVHPLTANYLTPASAASQLVAP